MWPGWRRKYFLSFLFPLAEENVEGTNSSDFIPETFVDVYAQTWAAYHKIEAVTNNPNPEAELVIVEEVEEQMETEPETEAPEEAEETDMKSSAGNNNRKLTVSSSSALSVIFRLFGF